MSDKKQFAVVMVVAAIFLTWILYRSVGIVLINNSLLEDEVLGAYPYHFRIMRKDGQTAVMSTLRSSQVSATAGLRALFPELRYLADDDPAMQEALRTFARRQARAEQLVTQLDGFDYVRWELDENWLRLHNVRPQLSYRLE